MWGIAAVASILGVLLPHASSVAAEPDDALKDFGACVSAGGTARVLLLMDTSASLRETDPEGTRVDAARYLMDGLGEFARDADASLDVAVAGFADSFEVSLPWTSVAGKGNARISEAVEKFADRDSGWETDYWLALQGARSYLGEGAPANVCKALVWLTDGMYDLDVRDSDEEREKFGVTKPYLAGVRLTSESAVARAERSGSTDLCRPGGVADALRADEITTLGIGLRGRGETADFGLMSGVATRAEVGGSECGRTQARGRGDFVLAEDVSDLFFAFDALSDPKSPALSQTTPLCQGEVCAKGRHSFVTDRSIVSATVLGSATVPGYEAVFVTPAGERLRLAPNQSLDVKRSGFTVRAKWRTDSVFSAKLERGTGAAWDGSWGVVFVDPSRSGRGEARTNIRLKSDLTPVWDGNGELVAGTKSPLALGIAVGDGSRLGPSDLAGDLTLDVVLDGAGREPVVLARGLTPAELQRPVVVDLTSQGPGPARLLLEMSLVTAGSTGPETPNVARSVGYEVNVQAPGVYPRLPRLVDFGRGDTNDAVTATLRWKGAGCVWLESASLDVLPSGVTGADLSAAADDRESCARDELVLSLSPENGGAGLLSGTATVKAVPAEGAGEALEFPVRVRYEMEPPADEVVRWWVFAVVLGLGVALPLLLLAALKKRGATLSGDGVAVAVLRGRIGPDGSFLDRVAIEREKDRVLTFSKRQAMLHVTNRARLAVRAHAWNPAAVPDVRLEDRSGFTSGGSSLPLALQHTWVATLDPHNPLDGDVEVVLIRPISGQGAEELLADARAKVPEMVAAIRQKAAPGTPAARRTDEWDGRGTSAGTTSVRVEDDEW